MDLSQSNLAGNSASVKGAARNVAAPAVIEILNTRSVQNQEAQLVPRSLVDPSPITSIGSVGLGNLSLQGRTTLPTVITATLDNSAGTSAVNYIIGDSLGLVVNAIAGTWVAPTAMSVPVAAFKSYLQSRPVMFKGFNYRITTGTQAQFSQAVKFSQAGLDASIRSTPLFIGANLRNTSFQTTIQTIEQPFTLDQECALQVTVLAGTVVALDLLVLGLLNAL